MNEVRKRFFINGEPSQGADEHGQYLEEADKLLAYLREMKKRQGLEQAKRVINHHDGTKITAISSIGFDEVWVDIPYFPPVPDPEDKEEEEVEEDQGDYLWIGIRPVQPIGTEESGAYCVGGLLIEPDGVHTFLGEFSLYENNLTFSASPVTDPDSFNYADFAEYSTTVSNYYQIRPVGFEPLAVYYDPDSFEHGGAIHFSPGGVMGYCIAENGGTNNTGIFGVFNPPLSVTNSLMPYDPKIPVEDAPYPNGQLRSPPNTAQISPYWGDPHWHNVFVLDPSPGTGPQENVLRDQDRYAHAVVKRTIDRLYGNSIKVKDGKYTLKVSLQGFCVADDSSPITLEIEVRVGKAVTKKTTRTVYGPDDGSPIDIEFRQTIPERVYKTTATIGRWQYDGRPSMPYGGGNPFPFFENDEMRGSPNPHGPMWWQGGIEIDVKNRTVEELDYLLPSVDIGFGPMFIQGSWDTANDRCPNPIWYPWMLSSFYPGTVPIGDTLAEQAYHFARTFYFSIWYNGEQGYNWATIDWSPYNLAPLISGIIAYATTEGRENLNGTKIIASGYPIDLGTRPDPIITILEMSTTSSTEWNALIAGGESYNGIFHHMRAVF